MKCRSQSTSSKNPVDRVLARLNPKERRIIKEGIARANTEHWKRLKDRICESCKVDQGVIWNALYQGYICGDCQRIHLRLQREFISQTELWRYFKRACTSCKKLFFPGHQDSRLCSACFKKCAGCGSGSWITGWWCDWCLKKKFDQLKKAKVRTRGKRAVKQVENEPSRPENPP